MHSLLAPLLAKHIVNMDRVNYRVGNAVRPNFMLSTILLPKLHLLYANFIKVANLQDFTGVQRASTLVIFYKAPPREPGLDLLEPPCISMPPARLSRPGLLDESGRGALTTPPRIEAAAAYPEAEREETHKKTKVNQYLALVYFPSPASRLLRVLLRVETRKSCASGVVTSITGLVSSLKTLRVCSVTLR